jgi:hypothetical protein
LSWPLLSRSSDLRGAFCGKLGTSQNPRFHSRARRQQPKFAQSCPLSGIDRSEQSFRRRNVVATRYAAVAPTGLIDRSERMNLFHASLCDTVSACPCRAGPDLPSLRPCCGVPLPLSGNLLTLSNLASRPERLSPRPDPELLSDLADAKPTRCPESLLDSLPSWGSAEGDRGACRPYGLRSRPARTRS